MRMQLLDWLIVILPIIALTGIAFYSRRYVRGVVDFLAAGRVAGRYVLAVGDLAAGLSVITLIAGAEQNYQTGFSVGFWSAVAAPIWIFISLSGYCVYRWRETRCLSMGQFLELRYGSKFFRIFCAALRTIAEMVMSVNLKGAYLCGKFSMEDMKKKNWGRMLHISSIWAYQKPNERMLSYAAEKSAMHAPSRGFAAIGAPYGITSNVLAPGLIMTKLVTERLTQEAFEREKATIPLGRGESPEEIALAGINMIRSSFITGEILNINGGAFMRP